MFDNAGIFFLSTFECFGIEKDKCEPWEYILSFQIEEFDEGHLFDAKLFIRKLHSEPVHDLICHVI